VQLLGELARCPGDLCLELLHATRRTHRPAVVAEIPLHLTGHGRDGVAEEVALEGGIEALDGLDQSDVRRLHQVFLADSPVAVPGGDGARHAHVQDDYLILEPLLLDLVVGLTDLDEESRGDLTAISLGRCVDDRGNRRLSGRRGHRRVR
jgi:hypothetical protein